MGGLQDSSAEWRGDEREAPRRKSVPRGRCGRQMRVERGLVTSAAHRRFSYRATAFIVEVMTSFGEV